MEWFLELNASIPGRASLFLLNDETWSNCNMLFTYNNQEIQFNIQDTLTFWYTSFVNPPYELIFKIGECIDLKNDNSKVNPSKFKLLNVYPNPFNSTINLNYHSLLNNVIDLYIININGQKVDYMKFISSAGYQSITIEPKLSSSGKYFLITLFSSVSNSRESI